MVLKLTHSPLTFAYNSFDFFQTPDSNRFQGNQEVFPGHDPEWGVSRSGDYFPGWPGSAVCR